MKNLANFKIAIRTREYLIQAIFQMLFDHQKATKIIKQFKEEHKTKKVDFKMFSASIKSVEKNKEKIEASIESLSIKILVLNLLINQYSILQLMRCSLVNWINL